MAESNKNEARARYEASRSGDLTTYAALMGKTFESRINLLAQLIRDAHDPSLGAYKERLLVRLLRDYIPTRFEVGTGFVLFPKQREFSETPAELDLQFAIDHEVSKQLDVVIFESAHHSCVFREEDFVVLRPEAVCSVIEVKGTLAPDSMTDSLEHFLDYAKKWGRCRSYYSDRLGITLRPPGMHVLGWQPYVGPDGKTAIGGRKARERVVLFYEEHVDPALRKILPIVDTISLYDDWIVARNSWSYGAEIKDGYSTLQGKLVRLDAAGAPELVGDKTIAGILASVQHDVSRFGGNFNPLFSYQDQTRSLEHCPHPEQGHASFPEDHRYFHASDEFD